MKLQSHRDLWLRKWYFVLRNQYKTTRLVLFLVFSKRKSTFQVKKILIQMEIYLKFFLYIIQTLNITGAAGDASVQFFTTSNYIRTSTCFEVFLLHIKLKSTVYLEFYLWSIEKKSKTNVEIKLRGNNAYKVILLNCTLFSIVVHCEYLLLLLLSSFLT